jgi:hypothetical protein
MPATATALGYTGSRTSFVVSSNAVFGTMRRADLLA